MSKDTKVTQIKGTITTADGKVTEFEIGEDFGWRQWGNDNTAPTLGTRVGVLEAIVAGLKDNEGGDFTFASVNDEDDEELDLEDDSDDSGDEPFDDEDEEEPTYKIVRFFSGNTPAKVKRTGLTLAQAKAHCADPASKSADNGQTWFDGFTKEG
jgi:hypothetical protein